MFIQQLLTIAITHALAVMGPGPDMAVIIRNATGYGRKTAVYTALGIATGIMFHSTYAILGISLLISNLPWLFNIIKFLGAGYLIYMGVSSLRSKGKVEFKSEKKHSTELNKWTAYTNGLFTNLLNPGASLFFLTLFTQVIEPETITLHKVMFAMEMVIATALWFSFLSFTISNPLTQKFFEKNKIWIDRAMGVVLILLALRVIFG